MSDSKLQMLKDNREEILLAEVGALLHDLGKISEGFLFFGESQKLWAKYHHLLLRRLANNITMVPDLTAGALQNGITNACRNIQHNQFDESTLIREIRQSGKISKNQAEVILGEAIIKDNFLAPELYDLLEETAITLIGEQLVVGDIVEEHSTPFFSRTSGRRNDRKKASQLIQHSDWCDSNADKGDADEPQKYGAFISSAFGYEYRLTPPDIFAFSQDVAENWQSRDLLNVIEDVFSGILGETRRNANDVTLWDHSYSVASLFKSAIAKVIIDGWCEPREIRWRLLRVNFDVLDLYSRAIKIADLLAYRQAVDDACEAVKKLVEYEYPLGNEVYRDTTGIYFTFPDIDLPAELAQKIRLCVEEIEPELAPRIRVGPEERVEGNAPAEHLKRLLADQRTGAKKELARPVSQENLSSCWEALWENLPPGNWEICPICRLCPMREGAEACKSCDKRRKSRIASWRNDPSNTIWIDEIADKNGRLTLIVGKFGLDDWLSGDLVQTMLVKVEENDPEACMPKNPSPARLRRVWETTQRFWEDTVGNLLNQLHDGIRWELMVDHVPSPKDLPDQACDGTLDGQPISVWPAGDRFLTISYVPEKPRAGSLDISWKDENQKKSRQIFEVREVRKAEGELAKFRCYAPYQVLLTSPDQFLALVPASEALKLTESIHQAYQQEFGKVQNRLPLFLGLVFFQRKMPLMAVMNTAQRMIERIKIKDDDTWKVDTWKVSKFENDLLTFENGFSWKVPTMMGDGTTPDFWYPYFFVKDDDTNGYVHSFQVKEGKFKDRWLLHVSELTGKEVSVTPSLFAYTYLEHTAQRFEFGSEKDVIFLDGLPRITKMWDNLVKSNITDTSLRGVVNLLAVKSESWGSQSSELRQLAETTLQLADLWEQKDKTGIVTPEDVTKGRFGHCLDLYLHILKRSLKEARDESTK